MRTRFEEIVDLASIGSPNNPIKMNDILVKATMENLPAAASDRMRVMLLCIDLQNDFEENGSLAVPKAHKDIENLTRFIYDNMEYLTRIVFSLDTHNPFQIFHPAWWIDENGKNPPPFTVISLADLDSGKWRAVINPTWSREYVENLEQQGRFKLVIWPYHCLQGTFGQTLEPQFANMVYFHSVAKKSAVKEMVKGYNPKTEMYGILKAEYDPQNKVNVSFLNDLKDYNMIIIAGEAKSHCVRRSIEQILEYFQNDVDTTRKIYILEDCMSSIPGFEADTEQAFKDFKKNYKVNLTNTKDLRLGELQK